MIHKNRSVFIISRTPSASQFVISKCLLVVDHECSTAFGSVFFFQCVSDVRTLVVAIACCVWFPIELYEKSKIVNQTEKNESNNHFHFNLWFFITAFGSVRFGLFIFIQFFLLLLLSFSSNFYFSTPFYRLQFLMKTLVSCLFSSYFSHFVWWTDSLIYIGDTIASNVTESSHSLARSLMHTRKHTHSVRERKRTRI